MVYDESLHVDGFYSQQLVIHHLSFTIYHLLKAICSPNTSLGLPLDLSQGHKRAQS